MPPILLVAVQVAAILVVARMAGWAFRRLHQPQVVGEMAAGILLGPSLLGWVAPGAYATLFPAEGLSHLATLSSIGLLLFMFMVGLEFDARLLRGRGQTAVVTSHVSIVLPFVLGAALALFLYPRLSDRSVPFTGFALFMGAAMSVTAFPVLARILAERKLLHTSVGAVAIASAAVGDVTAWAALAVVIALVSDGTSQPPLWLTIGGTAAYLVLMFAFVRPAAARLAARHFADGRLTPAPALGVLLLLLASAWTTHWLGVHALFGAFIAGAIVPHDPRLVSELIRRLRYPTVVVLLPLFFAFTGLRTSIGLVQGVEMWLYALLVLFVAVAGKFGGSSVAAWLTGLSWREARALGILMNTRGLMELVILTIGLELGVISPVLFTILVLMALVTTAMTTPILDLFYPEALAQASAAAPVRRAASQARGRSVVRKSVEAQQAVHRD